jgi:hypothetical protein
MTTANTKTAQGGDEPERKLDIEKEVKKLLAGFTGDVGDYLAGEGLYEAEEELGDLEPGQPFIGQDANTGKSGLYAVHNLNGPQGEVKRVVIYFQRGQGEETVEISEKEFDHILNSLVEGLVEFRAKKAKEAAVEKEMADVYKQLGRLQGQLIKLGAEMSRLNKNAHEHELSICQLQDRVHQIETQSTDQQIEIEELQASTADLNWLVPKSEMAGRNWRGDKSKRRFRVEGAKEVSKKKKKG